jgi:hypothetical protein
MRSPQASLHSLVWRPWPATLADLEEGVAKTNRETAAARSGGLLKRKPTPLTMQARMAGWGNVSTDLIVSSASDLGTIRSLIRFMERSQWIDLPIYLMLTPGTLVVLTFHVRNHHAPFHSFWASFDGTILSSSAPGRNNMPQTVNGRMIMRPRPDGTHRDAVKSRVGEQK